MKLPEWTVLPVIAGFFALLFTNSDFLFYIIGYRARPDETIDFLRLTINCFIMGIGPTFFASNQISKWENKNIDFRFWYISASPAKKQSLNIFLAVAYTVLLTLTTSKVLDYFFKEKMSAIIVSTMPKHRTPDIDGLLSGYENLEEDLAFLKKGSSKIKSSNKNALKDFKIKIEEAQILLVNLKKNLNDTKVIDDKILDYQEKHTKKFRRKMHEIRMLQIETID